MSQANSPTSSASKRAKRPHGVFRHHCQTCGRFFQARNINRHRKACLRRARIRGNHDRKPDTEAPGKNVNTCLAVVSSSGSAGEKR